MVHTFDEKKRSQFFDTTFAPTQFDLLKKGEITHLHPRDEILLNFLKGLPPNCRILDYGCGQGRLLGELLSRGYDAYGYEPSAGMGDIAVAHFVKDGEGRIFVGSDDMLSKLDGKKFDLVLLMGVMQYLSDEERVEVFRRCRGYLQPGGRIVATFQNGLFDLYTFNKYTIDAVTNMLLKGLLSRDEQNLVGEKLGHLLTHPDAPPYSASRARDNIFVRLSNPLTAKKDLAEHGLVLESLYFYEWFGLPPLIAGQAADIAKRIKSTFEVKDASDWRGHFMANAFLVVAAPAS